jgi:hypothetical protein
MRHFLDLKRGLALRHEENVVTANRSCAASRIERSELGLDLSQCAASNMNAE